MHHRNARLLRLIGSFLIALHCLLASAVGQASSTPKRAITAADGVTMTHVIHDWSDENTSGKPAYFSPDGTKFVVVLKKGNLEQDTNSYSVLLYRSESALQAPKPEVVLKMSSSSVRDGITQIRWLDDNDTLVFVGENPGEVAQLYYFQISTRTLKKLTNQPRPLRTYDISRDGSAFAYTVYPPDASPKDTSRERAREVAIEGQELDRIVEGDYALPKGPDLYWQRAGDTPRPVSLESGYFPDWGPVHISPDGRYILFNATLSLDRIKTEWLTYADQYLHQILTTSVGRKTPSPLREYMLVDTEGMSSAPVLDAPVFGSTDVAWSRDRRSLFLSSTYLPLDIADATERQARRKTKYAVKIDPTTREYEKIESSSIPVAQKQEPPVQVALEQDLNTPPKIYVADSKGQRKTLLLDLNPQFRDLEFGKVETIEWEVSDAKLIAGVYLPPDYQPGKRYPLVIQTHGFWPKEFSMDGRSEWSSGFAARPLAARGILVLQAHDWKDREKDHDRIGDDRSLGATAQESHKNFSALVFEGAIDFLDKKGMIDRNRVGIIGFSRTVCFVAYTLTHSKERFAAASLVDGIGCGYFDEMVSPSIAWDSNALNGGASPFVEGLKLWIKNSPGFNLDRVRTPIRLVALGKSSVLGDLWQWYAGLSLLKKPVDLVVIPDGTHIYGKPSECRLKQQGPLDWFTFWLKGEEDPDPAKAEQYKRWRELRKLQEENAAKPQATSSN